MKKFLFAIIFFEIFFGNSFATAEEEKPLVAVMNFGQYDGAVTDTISVEHLGAMSADYIVQALVESGYFKVVGTQDLQNNPELKNLNLSGIIAPSTAKKISEILGIKYIIYGNVSGVSGSSTSLEIIANGATIHTVKAKVIARFTDAQTGEIVAVVKGGGNSKSSLVKAGTEALGYFKVGTEKISQVSVHNAVKKASYSMVEVLLERLYDLPPKKIEQLFKGKMK